MGISNPYPISFKRGCSRKTRPDLYGIETHKYKALVCPWGLRRKTRPDLYGIETFILLLPTVLLKMRRKTRPDLYGIETSSEMPH